MAVNAYAGQVQPIQLVLTSGKNKTPVSAQPLTRVKLELFNRETMTLLDTVDSDVTPTAFFWTRTSQTVKGAADIYLLELELQSTGITVQEDLVARITLYDVANPTGISWKQFTLNSR
jgi:hypothetical protein